MKIKDTKIKFRTEIEFKGTIAELENVVASLADLNVEIGVQWPPDKTKGCWPMEPQRLVSGDVLENVIRDQPRFKLIKKFPGGITDPHLHIGDEIVLLGRDQFKEFVGQVAVNLAGDLAGMANHPETVGAIRNLARPQ